MIFVAYRIVSIESNNGVLGTMRLRSHNEKESSLS